LPPWVRVYGTREFCFARGVALNCTANSRMVRGLGFRSWIQPAAGDAGGAMGGALQSLMRQSEGASCRRHKLSPYLGLAYSEPVIRASLELSRIGFRQCAAIAEEIADRLAAGQLVAILQGPAECDT